eukprot:GHVS01061222.1.p2 GENE.GHVS01061222.1~~GHVS01061222.1.p2  ORF type:complete len:152 (+),score=14.19 GHVS01061222.1:1262-1717(+)
MRLHGAHRVDATELLPHFGLTEAHRRQNATNTVYDSYRRVTTQLVSIPRVSQLRLDALPQLLSRLQPPPPLSSTAPPRPRRRKELVSPPSTACSKASSHSGHSPGLSPPKVCRDVLSSFTGPRLLLPPSHSEAADPLGSKVESLTRSACHA